MNARVSRMRPTLRWLSLLPGVMLVFALLAGAVHDHTRDVGSHPCATCTFSHAPATTTIAVGVALPTPRYERVETPAAGAPRTPRLVVAPSRAPPIG